MCFMQSSSYARLAIAIMAESSSAIDSALEDTAKPLVTTLQIRPLMVMGE